MHRGSPFLAAQHRRTIPVSTPAPYKGLNTVDPLAAMDPAYGLSIQNFIATPQGLSLRNGYRKWATGLPAAVTALLPYHSGSAAASKLFAVSGSAIYDVTSSGAVGAAAVSGLNASAPYWQHTSQTYTTNGKHYLFAVNGSDFPRMYDGTSWVTTSQVASPTNPGEFKNVDSNGNSVSLQTFVDVLLHQQRLWFVRDNSTLAYYCDLAQVGGNLYPFDFGPLFPRGGKLHKLAAWTLDAGGTQGSQSLLVAISTKGDVAVYAGNNPASSTTWALTGTYQLGSPVGRRCTIQYEGDLLLLTRDGLYPLSKYVQSARLDTTSALTYKIAPTISDLVETFATTPGFELIAYPGQNVLLLNVPQLQATNNFQFCFNSVTKGWTQFTGWPASAWGLFNDSLYFGGSDFVALSFIGFQDAADLSGANGNNIIATALTAFTYMSEQGLGPGVLKHAKLVKPYIVTGSANPSIRVGVNVDFNLIPIVGSATLNPVTGAVWDTATWDSLSATWVGSLATYNQWATPLCYQGEALAFAISISATSDTLWTATSWIVEPGGQFG